MAFPAANSNIDNFSLNIPQGGQTQNLINQAQGFQSPTPLGAQTSGGLTGRTGIASGLSGLTSGLQTQAPGTSAGSAVPGVLSATASGAAAGAVVGGPWGAVIGGGVGLVSASAKAFFDISANRKRERELKALQKQAEKSRKQALAREIESQRVNRLDTLKSQRENRALGVIQDNWNKYLSKTQIMTNLINQNSTLTANLMQKLNQGAARG